MFILGSQIPTFSKQGMTDLEEYRCLLYSAAPISQDRGQSSRRDWKEVCVCVFLFVILFLSFRGGDGDAACILTTWPLSELYCIKFTLIDFFFGICPLKSVDGVFKMVMDLAECLIHLFCVRSCTVCVCESRVCVWILKRPHRQKQGKNRSEHCSVKILLDSSACSLIPLI